MKYFFSAILYATCLIVSCKSKNDDTKGKGKDGRERGNAPVVVDVIIATPQNVSDTIEANGTIVATESVELHPEVNGRITYLNVPEGRRISKGTIILRINDADIRAQIGKSKVQLDLANQTIGRYKKLIDIGGLNQADYDLAASQASGYQADIGVLRAELDKTVMRAPFSGIIGLRQVSPGAFITPSTVIATMQQVDKVRVDFTLPEEFGNIIHKGNYVSVQTDVASSKRQRALIVAIEPQVNTSTRNLMVRANLEGSTKLINPGAFVKVYINSGADKSSIVVPGNAIIPEDISNSLVVVKGGKSVYVKVETGVRRASNVEIVKGVNAGDSIVVSGVLFTKPNAPVKVRSVKKLEQIAQ